MAALTYKIISRFIKPNVKFVIKDVNLEMIKAGVKTNERTFRGRVKTLMNRNLLLKDQVGGKHYFYTNANRLALIADFDNQIVREAQGKGDKKLMLASDKQAWSKRGIQGKPGDTVKLSMAVEVGDNG